ncbi:putative metal-binding motif-containing protein [archaeon]|nr:putative metal-binding motif-containing protein [archaeon]
MKKILTNLIVLILVITLVTAQKCIDNDNDGVYSTEDCDDNNSEIWYLQDFYLDEDHDLFGTGEVIEIQCWGTEGYYIYPKDERAFNNDDCDDLNPDVNPNQIELCDGIDNNCNGIIDEGCYSNFFHYFTKT